MTVHLVGAGPGDPALLTGAALEALAGAEVVVYDRPSLDAVVALAPPAAERHCVGLAPGRRALTQDDYRLSHRYDRCSVRVRGRPTVHRAREPARQLRPLEAAQD